VRRGFLLCPLWRGVGDSLPPLSICFCFAIQAIYTQHNSSNNDPLDYYIYDYEPMYQPRRTKCMPQNQMLCKLYIHNIIAATTIPSDHYIYDYEPIYQSRRTKCMPHDPAQYCRVLCRRAQHAYEHREGAQCNTHTEMDMDS